MLCTGVTVLEAEIATGRIDTVQSYKESDREEHSKHARLGYLTADAGQSSHD